MNTTDGFGESVAIDETRAIVDGANAVHIFERSKDSWPKYATPIFRNGSSGSVAIAGNRAIAGDPSKEAAAYVFKRSDSGWTRKENKIRSPRGQIDDFGYSVAINDEGILIGSRLEDGPSGNTRDAGAAYVFSFASPPTAKLETGTNITATEATVSGVINPGGASTTAQVEYRTRDASTFQSVSVDESPLTGTSNDTVRARLTGLEAATAYQVRVVASNSEGADTSAVGTLVTPPSDPVADYRRTIHGTDGTGNDAGWRMLSVPAADVTRAQLEDDLTFDRFSPILYRRDGTGWIAQDQSSDALPRGTGFILYFFDDAAEPLDSEGLPLDVKKGSENLLSDATVDGLSTDNAFHLLGNPYATAFDADSLAGGDLPGAGFQATVQVWNPNAGQYEQIVQGAPGNAIPAWQGFFVQRTVTGAGQTSLSFGVGGKEPSPGALIGSKSLPKTVAAAKASARASKTSAAKSATKQAEVALQLSVANDNGKTVGSDQATLWFSEHAKSGYDGYEARDLSPPVGNSYVTATFPITRSDGTVEQRAFASYPYPTGTTERTVPLSVQGIGTSGTATLAWPDSLRTQVPEHWDVTLTDTKTGQSVDLRSQNYSFALSSSGKSGGSDAERFKVTLVPNSALAELVSFDGTAVANGLRLEWATDSAPSNVQFALQRRASTDGWTTVGRQSGTDSKARYTLTDTKLPTGADSLTYRLKQMGPNGTESVSKSITVSRGAVEGTALKSAYPNPASKQLTVHYTVPASAEDAQLTLYDVMGRTVRRLPVKPGRTTHEIDVSALASGTYLLRLQAEGTSQTEQVSVVQ